MYVNAGGCGGAAAVPVCVQKVMQGLTQELLVFQQEKGMKIE